VQIMASTSKQKRSYRETVPEPKPSPETTVDAGDSQGLSEEAQADSESVKELVSEGQFFEAAVISGVENAPDADVSEVTTHEVPEDDVPLEYQERDPDTPREI
jgi:hypothetical protein